ncbi:hypothetical protein WG909_14105 [Peptostreptococcaceae bacterium AGR-M142]
MNNNLKYLQKIFIILLIFFVLRLIMAFGIILNIDEQNNTNNKTAAVTLSIKNNTNKDIDSLYISSNYKDSKKKINIIKNSKEITNEFKLSYLDEGSALLYYTDSNNIEYKKIIVGYLMPTNKISIDINKASIEGFEITVTNL